MQIRVDPTKCQGHSRCVQIAPELFHQDDEGFSYTDPGDVPAELEAKAREAVVNCPENAIIIDE